MDSGNQIIKNNTAIIGIYPPYYISKYVDQEIIDIPLKNFITGAKPKWSKLRIQDLREFVNRLNDKKNESDLIEMFLGKYAELNVELNAKSLDEKTIFHWACGLSESNLVKILLQKSVNLKIDLNAKDKHGWTAFHRACSLGNINIVKILIENAEYSKLDLKIKTPSPNGSTAYELSKLFGEQDIVDLFKRKLPAGTY